MPINKVLVVGLGIMGGAIAQSLLEADYAVLGFDVDPERNRTAEDKGVIVSNDIDELISDCEVVISSLPSAAALWFLLEHLAVSSKSKIVIEMSTLSLEDKTKFRDELQRVGHVVLDCPISGTGVQAAVKDLVIFASGDSATATALSGLFLSFACCVFDLGEYGNGTRMKLIANTLVAIQNVATAEALLLARRAGLELRQVIECISVGPASSKVFQLRAPLMMKRQYRPPTMKMSVWRKDMELIQQLARDCGSPVPLFSASLPVYKAALEMGYSDSDTAVVMSVLEQQAGEC